MIKYKRASSAMFNNSEMVLYSDRSGLQGHCVRIVLAEKDIAVKINYVEDGERPEIIAEVNPYDSVLTLLDRDLVLYDEQVIMEYIDARFPHPPLLPVDPVVKAASNQLRCRVLKDLYSLIADIESSNSSKAGTARRNLRDNLTAIAPVFNEKDYFMSDGYTLVDCCMAPLLWRLPKYGIELPASTWPLKRYAERLFCRNAFKLSLSAVEEDMHSLPYA